MQLPFDHEKLNALLEAEAIDCLLVSSKHNVQYLLGGYRFFFFEHMDAMGLSRYLPIVGLPSGRFENSFYIGNPIEDWQHKVEPLWMEMVSIESWTSVDAAQKAADRLSCLLPQDATIAVERSFIPADAMAVLADALPNVCWMEAATILEELRAVKTPEELRLISEASKAIVDSMLAVMQNTPVGTTTVEIVESLRQEEITRGLNFDYCLVPTGPKFTRAASSQVRWKPGKILSLDSGGNKHGYIGDLARMAVMGEPTVLMQDLLAEVQMIQAATRVPMKAGVLGGKIFTAGLAAAEQCKYSQDTHFMVHGQGLVSHESPHLTATAMYLAIHEKRPLEAGMVLSIETEIWNKDVGFVKLEDTVTVTDDGWEAFGDVGRDWVVGGS